MPEEWIVRVAGQEYGPVDLDQLREWKEEGRLIRENEIREPGSENWFRASELPELFADVAPEPAPAAERPSTLEALLTQTWRIYRERFWLFLGLSALVALPSIGSQLSADLVRSGANGALSAAAVLAGLFNLTMLFLSFIAWPLYLAGIQIITSEHLDRQSISLKETLNRAVRYWPRVAALCLLVYGAFFLLIVFAFGILLMIATGASSPFLILTALGLLFLQVWMFGRLFASTLFWQQTAVLENSSVIDSLRESHALTHSRRDFPWFRRPLWRGALIVSIWTVLAAALSLGPDWSTLAEYFKTISTTQDPQVMLESLSAHAANVGLRPLALVLGVLQTILRPLLGIAFVLLYFTAKADRDSDRN